MLGSVACRLLAIRFVEERLRAFVLLDALVARGGEDWRDECPQFVGKLCHGLIESPVISSDQFKELIECIRMALKADANEGGDAAIPHEIPLERSIREYTTLAIVFQIRLLPNGIEWFQ